MINFYRKKRVFFSQKIGVDGAKTCFIFVVIHRSSSSFIVIHRHSSSFITKIGAYAIRPYDFVINKFAKFAKFADYLPYATSNSS